jgi:hypothetical protein
MTDKNTYRIVYRFDKMKDENFQCTDCYKAKMIHLLQSVSINIFITNGSSYSLKYLVNAQLTYIHILPTVQSGPWEVCVRVFRVSFPAVLF